MKVVDEEENIRDE